MFSLTEHSHSQSYDGYLDELIRIRSVIRCSTTAVLAELCLLPAIESGKSDCVVSSHQRKRSRERECVPKYAWALWFFNRSNLWLVRWLPRRRRAYFASMRCLRFESLLVIYWMLIIVVSSEAISRKQQVLCFRFSSEMTQAERGLSKQNRYAMFIEKFIDKQEKWKSKWLRKTC